MTVLPLGRIQVNGLKELTRVGSVLSRDQAEPSVFDLDDLHSTDSSSDNETDSAVSESESTNGIVAYAIYTYN